MFTEGDSLLFDSRKMEKSQGPYAVQIGKTNDNFKFSSIDLLLSILLLFIILLYVDTNII